MELPNSLQIGRHRCGLEHLAQSDGGLLLSLVDVRVPGMERLWDQVHWELSPRNRLTDLGLAIRGSISWIQ